MKMQEHEPLKQHTTFGIGGEARFLVEVRSDKDVADALALAKERGLRYTVLSGGSNVLVPDDGLDAVVIRFVGNLYSLSNGVLDSWAGTDLLLAIRSLGKQGYGGWEKLAGIPGSIGGAVRGNAGAFGFEIQDVVEQVRAMNAETGEVRAFTNAQCDFSYRHSYFKDHPEWIVLRASLRLSRIAPTESEKLANETIAERERRHLQNVRAAGSFFMNPVAPPEIVALFESEKGVAARGGRVPAGWLIEKAGMKGESVGDAVASEQHPNYIVNRGNATAADVRALAQRITAAVKEKFGVELSAEAAVLD